MTLKIESHFENRLSPKYARLVNPSIVSAKKKKRKRKKKPKSRRKTAMMMMRKRRRRRGERGVIDAVLDYKLGASASS